MSIKIIGCTDKDLTFLCKTCGIRTTTNEACKRLNLEEGIVVNPHGTIMDNKYIIA